MNTYAQLQDTVVAGSVEYLGEHELHEHAWPIVQQRLEQQRLEAVETCRSFVGTNRGSAKLPEILTAAAQGRVETLFVDRSAKVWGTFVPTSGEVVVHDACRPGDDELVDWVAAQTYLQRGTVYVVPTRGSRQRGPRGGRVPVLSGLELPTPKKTPADRWSTGVVALQ